MSNENPDVPVFDALSGSMRDFRHLPGANLLERMAPFVEWQGKRRDAGVWPLGRSTENGAFTRCGARTDEGEFFEGVNFASQDYLSLNSHPRIQEAAIGAIRDYGVHSAGSPALVGNTSLSIELEKRVGEFLGFDHVALFPTGWAAGYGAIKGLVRPSDHVLIDALGHACLQEGAQAATRNIHLFRHNRLDQVREKLAKIRSTDVENGILVVTESLFSMDSDTPDIRALQEIAHEFDATLMIDVAHDLGNLGPTGRGFLEMQDMLGKVDVVMGSFSKTFASNGGFVASRAPALKEYLRYYSSPNTFSNALAPVSAAIVNCALDIVSSEEGAQLRRALMVNIRMLRTLLSGCGFETYGDPSAIVCVKMGTEPLARLVSRRLPAMGMLANLVEFPAVPKGQARFRLQLMAKHTHTDILDAVYRFSAAHAEALEDLRQLEAGRTTLAKLGNDRPVARQAHADRHEPTVDGAIRRPSIAA